MKLSVVTSLYHSAPYIEEFYNRVSASAKALTPNYEIIFVNDGSPARYASLYTGTTNETGPSTIRGTL